MKKKISYNNTGELSEILDDAMKNLKTLVDINTVVGTPIISEDGTTIIPVSKIYVGIIAGGGELDNDNKLAYNYPFAGGTGAGFTVNPIGFLVIKNGETTFINTELNKSSDKLIEMANRTLKILLSNLKDKQWLTYNIYDF